MSKKTRVSFRTRPICLPLKALSCLPLCEGILSLSFGHGHTLCNLALNPEFFTSLRLFNVQFHAHSEFVIISLSSSSQNFLIVKCHNSLSLDLLTLCPMEDQMSATMLAPNVNQNSECRRSTIQY